jgi:hypothetical protein
MPKTSKKTIEATPENLRLYIGFRCYVCVLARTGLEQTVQALIAGPGAVAGTTRLLLPQNESKQLVAREVLNEQIKYIARSNPFKL